MSLPAVIYQYVVNEEKYPDGAVITKEGGHGNWAYVIVSGQVKVKRKTGRGDLTTDILKTGDIFGERGLFNKAKQQRSASVIAHGPVTVGLLDSNRIQAEFYKLPPHMQTFVTTLARRLDEFIERVVKMAGGREADDSWRKGNAKDPSGRR